MSATASAALVAGLRRCDERAFNDAYGLFGDRLYSFAVRLTGRRDAADELFQHAWVTLAEKAAHLPDDTNVLAWLLTVARNHWRSQHRRARTHQKNEVALIESHVQPSSPDVTLEQRARLDALERALAQLAEHHREVLVLMIEAEDVPQKALAQVLGVSPTVFRKRVSRARAALAALIGSDHPS